MSDLPSLVYVGESNAKITNWQKSKVSPDKCPVSNSTIYSQEDTFMQLRSVCYAVFVQTKEKVR